MKLPGAVLLTLASWATWATPIPHASCFDLASRRHQVDLDLLLAVASVESNWNADARSNMDAHGIMQIRWPVTARHLGAKRVTELYNPCLNIDLGARYLRELLTTYDDDRVLALAAYNYGPARIRRRDDIPRSVRAYARLVLDRQAELAGDMQAAPLPEGQRIEVIRFRSRDRARAFMRGLVARVPGATLSLESGSGHSIVWLNTSELTPSARHRITSLLPNLIEE
ncbi:MAG: lytic transglycosylase domain-containing protein [Gammaproteobacteria bacterium]|nr:lytic transglycosylase domain-containing protein [Gammaproteobacteria bacterium]